MFNIKLVRNIIYCLFVLFLILGATNLVSANDSDSENYYDFYDNSENYYVDDDDDDVDDNYIDESFNDDLNDDYIDDYVDNDVDDTYIDDNFDEYNNYYKWEWNNKTYFINLTEFNLKNEQVPELFTKHDQLLSEIETFQIEISSIKTSRNTDSMQIIDNLFEAINLVGNFTDFNDLLLSIKKFNISENSSYINNLKSLLTEIKTDNPDENFTTIDELMTNLENALNEEVKNYNTLLKELEEKFKELNELYDKYPFLTLDEIYLTAPYYDELPPSGEPYSDKVLASGEPYSSEKSQNNDLKKTHTTMKKTGIQILAILLLFLGISGFSFHRKG